MTNMPSISQLYKCKVCNHDERFIIQKMIDDGAFVDNVALKYQIELREVKLHISKNHREILLAYGATDSTLRKNGVDVGVTLTEFIELWYNGFKHRRIGDIKDSDAIKAMELYAKFQGNLINKHEVKITRTVEEALIDFLSDSEEEKVQDESIESNKS